MVRPLDESQRVLTITRSRSWLMCEVALSPRILWSIPMSKKNRRLVAHEPVEGQDFRDFIS